MKFTIAQIGENRLKKVLIEDKQNNPEKMCEVLKSDIYNVAKCYIEQPVVTVEAKQGENDEINFDIVIKSNRIKAIGVLAQ